MNFEHSFEQLNGGLAVCVTDDHKFGTDAFLLADFAAVRRKDTVCDLGTGCGIIPFLWCRHDAPKQIYCVDIQQKAIEQTKISVEKNNLAEKVFPICSDLKELKGKLPFGVFDAVTCNPPYKAENTGIISESKSDKIARHETMCSVYDVAKAAAKLLKFGGRLCVCQRPERLCDVLEAMRQNGIEPKRVRFVQQRETTAPWLFLAEGKKGSKPFLKVEKPLIIEGEGGFSRELLDIYGYKENLKKGEHR